MVAAGPAAAASIYSRAAGRTYRDSVRPAPELSRIALTTGVLVVVPAALAPTGGEALGFAPGFFPIAGAWQVECLATTRAAIGPFMALVGVPGLVLALRTVQSGD